MPTEIGASDAPASFGSSSEWASLCLCRRVGCAGLGTDEAVDQHGSAVRILRRIHAKIYGENGTSRAPRRQRGPRPPPMNRRRAWPPILRAPHNIPSTTQKSQKQAVKRIHNKSQLGGLALSKATTKTTHRPTQSESPQYSSSFVGPDLRVGGQLDQHLRPGRSALEPRRVDDEAHRGHHN